MCGQGDAPETSTETVGTHPTGMRTCITLIYFDGNLQRNLTQLIAALSY